MSMFLTVILAVFVFLFIILVHEFGHFVTAKMFHVKVPEFSIGFGPAIFKKKKGETLYSLRAFPLGGYVQMEGESEASEDENALCNKPVWQRMIITVAGAFLNIVMGFVVFTIIGFMFLNAMPTLKVSRVTENTPAAQWICPGDRIVAVNGYKVWGYDDFRFVLNTANPGEEIKLTVKRNGEKITGDITPEYIEEDGRYRIGVQMATEKMNLINSFKYGINQTFFVIKVVFYSLFMLVTGGMSMAGVSGPVGTVNVMRQAASHGLGNFLNLFAMLTVNIGIFNLLPIPALDGGRVFFMLIELIRRKPIDPKKEGLVHATGLVLLMLFMVLVTVNDISVIFKR